MSVLVYILTIRRRENLLFSDTNFLVEKPYFSTCATIKVDVHK